MALALGCALSVPLAYVFQSLRSELDWGCCCCCADGSRSGAVEVKKFCMACILALLGRCQYASASSR